VTRQPEWLDKAALLLLHEESLALFGGARGRRDEGLLDSALARAANKFHYDDVRDLADLAAAYGFGLAKNHAFVDGNKRAAFLAIGLFLSINGKRLVAEQVEAIRTILALAAGDVTEVELAAWIKANLGGKTNRRR
jgi:death on curing protein